MKPVSTHCVSSAVSTRTVFVCPPRRESASKSVISCWGCSRCAAVNPDMPLPTMAIFTPSTTGQTPNRTSGSVAELEVLRDPVDDHVPRHLGAGVVQMDAVGLADDLILAADVHRIAVLLS